MVIVKRLILIFTTILLALFLAACGNEDNDQIDKKNIDMTHDKVLEVLNKLIDPYMKTQHVKTEKEVDEVMTEINEVAIETKRMLKRDYEKGINSVDDLINFAELFNDLYMDYEEGNVHLLQSYGEDIGKALFSIAEDYTDGELPKAWAEETGRENIYD